jgi:hypothetical protein
MEQQKAPGDAKPSVLSDRLRLDFISAMAGKRDASYLRLIESVAGTNISANELLLKATWQCNPDAVKWLLENMSIDVNWQNEKGETALMLAVSPKIPRVERIFDALNASMREGYLDQRSAEIIVELRKAGADPGIRNNAGKSTPDLAYNRYIRKALGEELRDAKPVRARIAGV